MKIGILVDSLKVGGVEKIAINQVKYLREIGEDAYLLVLRKENNPAEKENVFELTDGEIPIEVLDDRFPKFLKFSFKFPTFAFFSFHHISYALLLPFFIKRKEYDYIVSHGSYTSFSAFTIRLVKGIYYSIFFWDPVYYILNRVYGAEISSLLLKFLSFLGTIVDRYLVRSADYVLVGSEEHNKYFRKIYPDIKIKLILPGIKLGTPTSNKKDYILALTAWKAGKHPEYMIELAKQLVGVNFKIAGKWLDAKLREDFENLVATASMIERFDILGYVPEHALQPLYTEATVLLTTNLEKGFGIPVLEAAACGTTFISPEGSGVCCLFENGVDGFFTKERDTKEIVEKLQLLITNRDLAVKMGLSAFNKVKNGYTWQAHARKLVEAVSVFVSYEKSTT